MRHYMIEYFYDLGDDTFRNPSVSYVVRAYDTTEAIQLMAGLHHSEYTERIISVISEDEYKLMQTDQLDAGVWRVTREQTRIISVLNHSQNKKILCGIQADINTLRDTLRA